MPKRQGKEGWDGASRCAIPCDQKSLANSDCLCDENGRSDPHPCDTQACGEKSLANGDARFWVHSVLLRKFGRKFGPPSSAPPTSMPIWRKQFSHLMASNLMAPFALQTGRYASQCHWRPTRCRHPMLAPLTTPRSRFWGGRCDEALFIKMGFSVKRGRDSLMRGLVRISTGKAIQ